MVDLTVEYNEWFVAEKVKEQPRTDKGQQDKESEGFPDKTEEHGEEDGDGVVCLEVDDVGFDSGYY